MTKQVQRRRGTSTQHTSFTGAEGEISVNTTNKSIHVHDGLTAGGVEAARADLTNVSDANLNAALSGNTLSSLTITSVDINGGTIDGAVIGGSSAAAGTFTTVTASGDVTIADKIVHSGDTNTAIRFPAADTVTVETSGAERLRVDSSGNVGVGTASPAVRLEASGGIADVIAGTAQVIARSGDNTNFNQIRVRATATESRLESLAAGTGTSSPLVIHTGGTERMRIDSSGNVGIGTSSPASLLEVRGATGIIGRFRDSTNGIIDIKTTGSTNSDPMQIDALNRELSFAINSTERMRIDSSGNLGLGVTPSAWGSSVKVAQVSNASIAGQSNQALFSNNAFFDGAGWKYISSAVASQYYLDSNARHQWLTAPSGTAGNAITFTQAMTLDASGNLGVGVTSPGAKLDVATASGDCILRLGNGTSQARFAVDSDGPYIYPLTSGDTSLRVFNAVGTQAMTLDSSGNLLVGTTVQNGRVTIRGSAASSKPLGLDSNASYAEIQSYDNGPLYLNRQGNDVIVNSGGGNLLVGTTVNANSYRAIINGDVGLRTDNDSAGTTTLRLGNSTSMPQGIASIGGIKTAVGSGVLTFSTAFGGGLGEAARIDASGNLLVGTTSVASGKLNVVQGTSSALTVLSQSSASGDGATSNTAIRSTNLLGTAWANTRYDAYTHTWGIGGSASSNSAMTLDASGNLLVGTTSGLGRMNTSADGASQAGLNVYDTNTSSTNYVCVNFIRNGSGVGYISTTNVATSYVTSSDYRLKEDVQPMVGASNRVLSLNPVNFAWKADGSRTDGFIAHEVQEVAPYAVTGEKDGEQMQGMDHSKLVPLLTAALQEALTEIAGLKARITALEA